MNDEEKQTPDDEISLIDLLAVLWRHRSMIIAITVSAVILVVALSVISLMLPPEKSFLPNEYTPKVLMLINDPSSSGGGGLSSLLSNSNGLGSLASLAGLSTSGSTYSKLAEFIVGTDSFLDSVVDEFDLVERYEIKKFPKATSRKALKKLLTVETDEDSKVFTLKFTDIDPVFAQSVVNYAAAHLGRRFDELGIDKNKIEKENLEKNIATTFQEIVNLEEQSRNLEHTVISTSRTGTLPSIMVDTNRINLELEAQKQVYTQLKVQYESIKITLSSEKPVFQILEYAEVPDQKSGPSRGLICIIVTFVAAFFAVFLAFVLNAIENIKKDPEAMAKLQAGTKKRGEQL